MLNEAYKNGGFILIFNVKKGTQIGLNWFECLTDDNFLGFKMVPSDRSVNFLYANAVDKDTGISGAPGARVGYFFKLTRPGEILYLYWDSENEILSELTENKAHEMNLSVPNLEQLKSIDHRLAPFPYKTGLKWKSLSSNVILEDNVLNSEGHDKFLHYDEYREKYWFDLKNASAMDKYLYREDSSWLFKAGLCGKRFGLFRAKIFGVSSQKSVSDPKTPLKPTLRSSKTYDIEKFLSDFELNFINFVLGQDFDSFEHWKIILKIFSHYLDGFSCKTSHTKNYMSKFIRTLIIQLVEFPKDMMDVSQEDNLLFVYLCKIIKLSRQSLPERSARLHKFISEQFGWRVDLDSRNDDEYEAEDEKPVIVVLDH